MIYSIYNFYLTDTGVFASFYTLNDINKIFRLSLTTPRLDDTLILSMGRLVRSITYCVGPLLITTILIQFKDKIH